MSEKERNPYDPPKKRLRIGRVIFYIFSTALIVLLVAILFNVIITRKSGEPPSVFGYSIFIVTTSSMEPEMPPGAAVLVRKTDPADLKVGDVITFREGLDEDGNLLVNTHRIIEVNQEGGQYNFRTKGDNNNVEDQKTRYEEDLLGKALVTMPAVGQFFAFIKQPIGLATCVAIPLLLLLVFEIINLIRLSRKPKENELPFPEPLTGDEDEEELANQHFSPAIARKRALFEDEDAGLPSDALSAGDSSADDVLFAAQPRAAARPAPQPFPAAPVPVPSTPPVKQNWQELGNPAPQPRADLYGMNVQKAAPLRPAAPAPVPNTNYGFRVQAEPEDVPLENAVESIGGLSYIKPGVVSDKNSELYATQEFSIRGAAPAPAEAPAAQPQPRPAAYAAPAPTVSAPPVRSNDFVADVASQGKDQFKIDGIDVRVKPDAIKLALDEDVKERDISITVTREYTNVTVGTKDNEVNFALFRDENDDGQKVIIQRKNK